MEHWGKWKAQYGKNEPAHFFHQGLSMFVLSDAFSLVASYLVASEISVLPARHKLRLPGPYRPGTGRRWQAGLRAL